MKYRILSNLHDKFCFAPLHISGMTVEEFGTLTVVNSHLATDMFNILFINKAHVPTEAELTFALNTFKSEKLPFAFWLTLDEEKELADFLKHQKLKCTEVELGMCLDTSHIQNTAKINPQLKIKTVKSHSNLHDWTQVFCSLLPEECAPITHFYEKTAPLLDHFSDKMRFYVGYLDNQPVTTCALFFSGEVAGIFDMITVPSAQRQGIATTMMLHAIHEAKLTGFHYVSLGASEEGKHVYTKLGFKTYCEFRIYTPQNDC